MLVIGKVLFSHMLVRPVPQEYRWTTECVISRLMWFGFIMKDAAESVPVGRPLRHAVSKLISLLSERFISDILVSSGQKALL
ncbi:hypothetical protein [Bifidobacterium lemurum]|uniref:hypothetical protein n=1 Tax=Bifidobacterium lemurum TaxID=1603886 RepID=UPI001160618E|nr:hypothetical protein [Bifidobacterium lemurum]QOL34980.1 hypothetical protein BL8807_03640 [Bifidobacterium lemurum]